MKQIDLNKYKEFVKAVTSEDSNSTSSMCETIDKLESASGVNMSLLLTGAVGISAESGEFMEIVKKCLNFLDTRVALDQSGFKFDIFEH